MLAWTLGLVLSKVQGRQNPAWFSPLCWSCVTHIWAQNPSQTQSCAKNLVAFLNFQNSSIMSDGESLSAIDL